MEEKLYFAPAKYGKSDKKGDKKKFLKLAGFLIFLLILGIIIFWFLRGKTTVSGNFPANIGAESLTCSKQDAIYDKISYTGGNKKRARITAVFDGAETLRTLSFSYSLFFSSNPEAKSAESIAHYAFARDLADHGYDFAEFNNKFSILSNELVISLFAEQNEINSNSTAYFMINPDNFPVTLAEYRKAYESAGFICTSTIDNK